MVKARGMKFTLPLSEEQTPAAEKILGEQGIFMDKLQSSVLPWSPWRKW